MQAVLKNHSLMSYALAHFSVDLCAGALYRRAHPMVLLGACITIAFVWSLIMSWLGWM